MRNFSRNAFCCLAVWIVVADASGVVTDLGAFQAISKGNVFRLKDPGETIIEPPPRPLPKLILTGITTILGDKRALLKVQPPAQSGKLADSSKEQYLMLTEGQREGDVEVLQIDVKRGTVKVNNSGTIMTLTFEKEGPSLPGAPPQRTRMYPEPPPPSRVVFPSRRL